MTSPTVVWDDDGTPRSPMFSDVYRSSSGGLEQARHVFLQGCGLPQAWRDRPQWRILETGFGLGLNFLAAWRAWKDDPERPRLLHFVSIEAWPVQADDLRRSVAAYPELQPLADELAGQWWGLLPGFHRLSFEGGRVLLTLCIGDVKDMLREQSFRADSVFLDGFSPDRNAPMWELSTLKAVARLCRRGTGLATWTVAGTLRRELQQCGFRVDKAEGLPPKRHCLRGVYDPAWPVKGLVEQEPVHAGRCIVVGAGLAGACVAAALARRGWQVEVLDAASAPAAGASGLPAGLMAPHQSPDDNMLSRLTRCGIRLTLQQANAFLQRGTDWQECGVLEHRVDDDRPAPNLGPEGQMWTREADAAQKTQALLDDSARAWWHKKAAWVKPAALVRAWLDHPHIVWHGGMRVHRLTREHEQWVLLGDQGNELARAPMVVIAAAHGSAALLEGAIKLNPVRGQVTWDTHRVGSRSPWPAFPVNGHGHFLPNVPTQDGDAWFIGATYGRADSATDVRSADHLANLDRVRELLPSVARVLEPDFLAGEVQAWCGVRCASTDRRPLVGQLQPDLWLSAALGSRGLSFAVLCAELLAARLHGEPLPLGRKLADALALERQQRGANTQASESALEADSP